MIDMSRLPRVLTELLANAIAAHRELGTTPADKLEAAASHLLAAQNHLEAGEDEEASAFWQALKGFNVLDDNLGEVMQVVHRRLARMRA